MVMVVMISCDRCDDSEQEPVGMDDGVNSIEAHLEGWTHDDGEDLCPTCSLVS